MNQQLAEGYPDGFDEVSIAERGERLAKQILAIWPGPLNSLPS
jgi:hypothetical protein